MTGLRRALVLVGLSAAVTVGAAIPASATFADSATVTTTVPTDTVAAPGAVNVAVTYCHPVFTVDATVSWSASSTTRGVLGYRITAYLNNGTSAVMAEPGAATRSYAASFDRYYLQFQPRVTVTTLTTYGWTRESAQSAVISC